MEELFGMPMSGVMLALLVLFLSTVVVVVALGLRNRVIAKMGLRPIPRRPGQSALIIVGVMLSTVIMAAAFGTGDTISYSIRDGALTTLAEIDEIIVSVRAGEGDRFGVNPYITYERFERLRAELAGDANIDGLAPQLAETAPAVNPRTSLSEGRMRVVGIDPGLLQGFGEFESSSGEAVRLDDLAGGEAYINDKAAEELDAEAGDGLELFIGDGTVSMTVAGVLTHGGLAGRDPTLLLPLERAQSIFDRPGQVNLIAVSNRGDRRTGAELSEAVTERLRVQFTDREVAAELKELLAREDAGSALEAREDSLLGAAREEFARFRAEIAKEELTDELVSLMGDSGTLEEVLTAFENAELRETTAEAIALIADLGQFRVFDIKHDALATADEAGSGTTSVFITMALFSIGVGVLLIFLIFVMLAAARRSEMGMARAVGAKRGHMVQMFLFEGTAYALIAAAVGVLIGLGISAAIVGVVNSILSSVQDDFQMVTHFEPRSVVVAYCLGMAITFGTVVFSAYRVSRLNIVTAIRDLPQALLSSEAPPFRVRLLALLRAIGRPFILLGRSFRHLRRRRPARSARDLVLAVLWVVVFPIWLGDIGAGIFRFAWPYLLQGWLTAVSGAVFVWWGLSIDRDSPFAAGSSLLILGLGLMGRRLLDRTSMQPARRDRVAYTATGLVMLASWMLPQSLLEPLVGELEGDFDMMFVSGIFMVGAAVWAIMWNADLMVKAAGIVAGRAGRLRPVLVTAVAYPMSSRFRTGLTLAMFALVIFTLMVMSVMTESFSTSFSSDPETVSGGWDVQGEVNPNTPIEDIGEALAGAPKLRSEDFEAIGGYTRLDVSARQVGAESQRWEGYALRAADDSFIGSAEYRLKLIADGYGPTPEELWEALRTQPNLTVIEGQNLGTRSGPENEWPPFIIEGPPYYDDDRMLPVEFEVREPRTGTIIPLKVVAVLDKIHESFDDSAGMIVSRSTVTEAMPFPVPVTTYQFRLAEGVDPGQAARDIEASFLEYGMETVALVEMIEELTAAVRGFFSIFTGFMGLGVVVGIAALGVVSTRAVVERRQQIGVLRALGYRRLMVQLSFLLEFSFVALLGTALGVVLGIVLGYQAISDIRSEQADQNLRFVVPWVQIVVIVSLTYLFSLLATYLPARQASRIYPAEALRYE